MAGFTKTLQKMLDVLSKGLYSRPRIVGRRFLSQWGGAESPNGNRHKLEEVQDEEVVDEETFWRIYFD